MVIKNLSIEGLRGFSEKREFNFSIPDKVNPGSGLTVLVGPNNSGKSTVIEAIHILNSNSNIIPKNYRNVINSGKIKIEAVSNTEDVITVQSTENGGSYVERILNSKKNDFLNNPLNAFILTSKRNFSSTFSNNGQQSRENYKGNVGNESYRNENNVNHNFGGRLLRIFDNKKQQFNDCLNKVLDPIPNWTIESSSENQMFLEFSFGKTNHSSQGAGDGYINIFNIIDALYDSSEDNVILIDEPEVSLHPDLQRKLFQLLVEYSKDKQIIISTHSPYFVDWELFSTYSKIIRLRKEKEVINLYELSFESKQNIKKILNDTHNLHTLSLTTNEIFFLNDNIILTEGQEDVYGYKKIFMNKGFKCNASFFGWGSGGADKVFIILKLLEDLGYQKVFTILDNDKSDNLIKLQDEFPAYYHYAIAADDIRDKPIDRHAQNILDKINKLECDDKIKLDIVTMIKEEFPSKKGILNKLSECIINHQYEDTVCELIDKISFYFNDKNEVKVEKVLNHKNDNNNIDEEEKVQQILSDYLKNNSFYDMINKKYYYINFRGGNGGPVSIKKINDNEFYVILEHSQGLSEKESITVQYHLIINIETNNVKMRKQKTISNTLPKKY